MWNDDTMKALQAWLGPDTGLKGEMAEDDRFYDFVLAVWDELQTLWNEAQARETIIREAESLHPDADKDSIIEIAEARIAEGTLILEFLMRAKASGRCL